MADNAIQPSMPDDIRRFNHDYNVQFQVNQCMYNSSKQEEFVNSVNVLEKMIVSDYSADKYIKMCLEKKQELKLQNSNIDFDSVAGRTAYALERFAILYTFAKTRRRAVVLAIGRPACHKCGEEIKWGARERAEARRQRNKEQKDVPTEQPKQPGN